MLVDARSALLRHLELGGETGVDDTPNRRAYFQRRRQLARYYVDSLRRRCLFFEHRHAPQEVGYWVGLRGGTLLCGHGSELHGTSGTTPSVG